MTIPTSNQASSSTPAANNTSISFSYERKMALANIDSMNINGYKYSEIIINKLVLSFLHYSTYKTVRRRDLSKHQEKIYEIIKYYYNSEEYRNTKNIVSFWEGKFVKIYKHINGVVTIDSLDEWLTGDKKSSKIVFNILKEKGVIGGDGFVRAEYETALDEALVKLFYNAEHHPDPRLKQNIANFLKTHANIWITADSLKKFFKDDKKASEILFKALQDKGVIGEYGFVREYEEALNAALVELAHKKEHLSNPRFKQNIVNFLEANKAQAITAESLAAACFPGDKEASEIVFKALQDKGVIGANKVVNPNYKTALDAALYKALVKLSYNTHLLKPETKDLLISLRGPLSKFLKETRTNGATPTIESLAAACFAGNIARSTIVFNILKSTDVIGEDGLVNNIEYDIVLKEALSKFFNKAQISNETIRKLFETDNAEKVKTFLKEKMDARTAITKESLATTCFGDDTKASKVVLTFLENRGAIDKDGVVQPGYEEALGKESHTLSLDEEYLTGLMVRGISVFREKILTLLEERIKGVVTAESLEKAYFEDFEDSGKISKAIFKCLETNNIVKGGLVQNGYNTKLDGIEVALIHSIKHFADLEVNVPLFKETIKTFLKEYKDGAISVDSLTREYFESDKMQPGDAFNELQVHGGIDSTGRVIDLSKCRTALYLLLSKMARMIHDTPIFETKIQLALKDGILNFLKGRKDFQPDHAPTEKTKLRVRRALQKVETMILHPLAFKNIGKDEKVGILPPKEMMAMDNTGRPALKDVSTPEYSGNQDWASGYDYGGDQDFASTMWEGNEPTDHFFNYSEYSEIEYEDKKWKFTEDKALRFTGNKIPNFTRGSLLSYLNAVGDIQHIKELGIEYCGLPFVKKEIRDNRIIFSELSDTSTPMLLTLITHKNNNGKIFKITTDSGVMVRECDLDVLFSTSNKTFTTAVFRLKDSQDSTNTKNITIKANVLSDISSGSTITYEVLDGDKVISEPNSRIQFVKKPIIENPAHYMDSALHKVGANGSFSKFVRAKPKSIFINRSEALSDHNVDSLTSLSLQFLEDNNISLVDGKIKLTDAQKTLLVSEFMDKSENIYKEIHAIEGNAVEVRTQAISKLKTEIEKILKEKLTGIPRIDEINWNKWDTPQLKEKLQEVAINVLTHDEGVVGSEADFPVVNISENQADINPGYRKIDRINADIFLANNGARLSRCILKKDGTKTLINPNEGEYSRKRNFALTEITEPMLTEVVGNISTWIQELRKTSGIRRLNIGEQTVAWLLNQRLQGLIYLMTHAIPYIEKTETVAINESQRYKITEKIIDNIFAFNRLYGKYDMNPISSIFSGFKEPGHIKSLINQIQRRYNRFERKESFFPAIKIKKKGWYIVYDSALNAPALLPEQKVYSTVLTEAIKLLSDRVIGEKLPVDEKLTLEEFNGIIKDLILMGATLEPRDYFRQGFETDEERISLATTELIDNEKNKILNFIEQNISSIFNLQNIKEFATIENFNKNRANIKAEEGIVEVVNRTTYPINRKKIKQNNVEYSITSDTTKYTIVLGNNVELVINSNKSVKALERIKVDSNVLMSANKAEQERYQDISINAGTLTANDAVTLDNTQVVIKSKSTERTLKWKANGIDVTCVIENKGGGAASVVKIDNATVPNPNETIRFIDDSVSTVEHNIKKLEFYDKGIECIKNMQTVVKQKRMTEKFVPTPTEDVLIKNLVQDPERITRSLGKNVYDISENLLTDINDRVMNAVRGPREDPRQGNQPVPPFCSTSSGRVAKNTLATCLESMSEDVKKASEELTETELKQQLKSIHDVESQSEPIINSKTELETARTQKPHRWKVIDSASQAYMAFQFVKGTLRGDPISIAWAGGGIGLSMIGGKVQSKLELFKGSEYTALKGLGRASPIIGRAIGGIPIIFGFVTDLGRVIKGEEGARIDLAVDTSLLAIDAIIATTEVFAIDTAALTGVELGPVGVALSLAIMIGADIYHSVKEVEKYNKVLHFTLEERFKEGLKAFIGFNEDTQVRYTDALGRQAMNQKIADDGAKFLKDNKIKIGVFSLGGLETTTDRVCNNKLGIVYKADRIILDEKPSSSRKIVETDDGAWFVNPDETPLLTNNVLPKGNNEYKLRGLPFESEDRLESVHSVQKGEYVEKSTLTVMGSGKVLRSTYSEYRCKPTGALQEREVSKQMPRKLFVESITAAKTAVNNFCHNAIIIENTDADIKDVVFVNLDQGYDIYNSTVNKDHIIVVNDKQHLATSLQNDKVNTIHLNGKSCVDITLPINAKANIVNLVDCTIDSTIILKEAGSSDIGKRSILHLEDSDVFIYNTTHVIGRKDKSDTLKAYVPFMYVDLLSGKNILWLGIDHKKYAENVIPPVVVLNPGDKCNIIRPYSYTLQLKEETGEVMIDIAALQLVDTGKQKFNIQLRTAYSVKEVETIEYFADAKDGVSAAKELRLTFKKGEVSQVCKITGYQQGLEAELSIQIAEGMMYIPISNRSKIVQDLPNDKIHAILTVKTADIASSIINDVRIKHLTIIGSSTTYAGGLEEIIVSNSSNHQIFSLPDYSNYFPKEAFTGIVFEGTIDLSEYIWNHLIDKKVLNEKGYCVVTISAAKEKLLPAHGDKLSLNPQHQQKIMTVLQKHQRRRVSYEIHGNYNTYVINTYTETTIRNIDLCVDANTWKVAETKRDADRANAKLNNVKQNPKERKTMMLDLAKANIESRKNFEKSFKVSYVNNTTVLLTNDHEGIAVRIPITKELLLMNVCDIYITDPTYQTRTLFVDDNGTLTPRLSFEIDPYFNVLEIDNTKGSVLFNADDILKHKFTAIRLKNFELKNIDFFKKDEDEDEFIIVCRTKDDNMILSIPNFYTKILPRLESGEFKFSLLTKDEEVLEDKFVIVAIAAKNYKTMALAEYGKLVDVYKIGDETDYDIYCNQHHVSLLKLIKITTTTVFSVTVKKATIADDDDVLVISIDKQNSNGNPQFIRIHRFIKLKSVVLIEGPSSLKTITVKWDSGGDVSKLTTELNGLRVI